MSHYDDEADVSWAVLIENRPSREMVTIDSASGLEKKLIQYVCENQNSVQSQLRWCSFIGGERQSILGGVTVEDETQTVFRDVSFDVDDVVFDLREDLRNDDVISALYRLRVPFRVIVRRQHRENGVAPIAIEFQLAETAELLEAFPPEPEEVIKSRDDGRELLDMFIGVPTEDRGFIEETDLEFPGCSVGEWESMIGRDLTEREVLVLDVLLSYTPRPTEDGFNRAMDVGEAQVLAAEEVAEECGLSVF